MCVCPTLVALCMYAGERETERAIPGRYVRVRESARTGNAARVYRNANLSLSLTGLKQIAWSITHNMATASTRAVWFIAVVHRTHTHTYVYRQGVEVDNGGEVGINLMSADPKYTSDTGTDVGILSMEC